METVGSVTSPVTQVDVVAVNSASRYGTASPVAELIGNANNALPKRIVTRKLSNMICVVESVNFFFITITFPLKSIKEPTSSAVSWFLLLLFVYVIISRFVVYVNIFLLSMLLLYVLWSGFKFNDIKRIYQCKYLFFSTLYAIGDRPYTFLKVLIKCEKLPYPQFSQIFVILSFVSMSNFSAL